MDGETKMAAALVVLCGLALGQTSCTAGGAPPGNPVPQVMDTTGPLAPGGGSNGAGSVIGSGAGGSGRPGR